MKKTIKDYRDEIRMLRLDYETERRERMKLERELAAKTAWIRTKFDWWPTLIAEGKTPCLKYLIKDTAKILGASV